MLRRSFLCVEKEGAFLHEISYLRNKLQKIYLKNTLIGAVFFINANDDNDFFEKKHQIKNEFKESFSNMPVNVVSQCPCEFTSVEIWCHDSCEDLVHKEWNGLNYTVYKDVFGKSIFGFGLSLDKMDLSILKQMSFPFEVMNSILSMEGFSIDHVVRQWNYIPHILKVSCVNDRYCSNYQLFNDVRQQFYTSWKRSDKYPAATGIGVDNGTFTIDFLAIGNNEIDCVRGLNNPNQVNAYQYGPEVLGGPLLLNQSKKTPLFERAQFVGNRKQGNIFVSGTASILGEKTNGQNDVVKQMKTTIKNISVLISDNNLKQIDKHFLVKKKYTYLRVYIKRKEDFHVVIELCKKQFGEVPLLCVKADICRDDLLLEIEGEVGVWECNLNSVR